uniref:Protein yippee-like n=1 Tax=Palpitomonas bilix TaxID=652834 RepID=A0A7S3LSI2_9EUKA|mmetsp:Transcript_44489/g.115681  ORF Transcript_44489/g.115681 Transcript_44489/m.115681 type:complete len:135 (+) Transcript_44489:174-578(+)
MGRVFKTYLSGSEVYCCGECRAHLCTRNDLVSKSFRGQHGRAYLFSDAVNYAVGPEEARMLMTGLHRVCDVYCNVCSSYLGWKYVSPVSLMPALIASSLIPVPSSQIEAMEESQKYKEGKYVLEKAKMLKEKDW